MVVGRPTYTALASRDGRWWLIRVPGLGHNPEDGIYTQARKRGDIEPMARELIALCLEVSQDSFDVQVELPGRS